MNPLKRILPALLGCAAALATATPAHAALVSLGGKITDTNGTGIFGVQIAFIDTCTGATAVSSGGTTSSAGTFSAVVNAGTYDVEFTPPAGSLFTAYRIRNLALTTNTSLPTFALPFGVLLSGTVTDLAGTRLAGVFIHIHPPGNSERIFTVRDKTDTSGNYSVVVPIGLWDIRYGPPSGTRFLTSTALSIAISGNTTRPTVALQAGTLVGGIVNSPAGPGHPVNFVNLDAIDAVTGQEMSLSHDRTDATGLYSLALPPGTYSLQYKPEHCTSLLVQAGPPVVVAAADLTLPAVTLAAGLLVKGTVTDRHNTPVEGADTDYFGSLGQVLTADDHTDATGTYSAVVPPDTYTVHYSPAAGVRLAGVTQGPVAVAAPLTLPAVQLPDAFFVTGLLVDAARRPIGGGDLDFYPAGTFSRLFTPHDGTDAAGAFQVAVVNDRYDIRLQGPPGSALASRRLTTVVVNGADVDLGTQILPPGFMVSGHIVDGIGNPVAGADLDFRDVYTNRKADTPGDNTDLSGNFTVTVAGGLYNVKAIPPAGSGLQTGLRAAVTVVGPTTGVDFLLGTAVPVSGVVVDPGQVPVGAVDLDFYVSATGAALPVSRDNSAADGSFAVDVPVGTYDVVLTPPTLSGLAPRRLAGIAVPGPVSLGEVPLIGAVTATVASIAPATGPEYGGTAVTITGSGFQPGLLATLGGITLQGSIVVDATHLQAVTPGRPLAAASELVDLVVTNHGAAAATLPFAFNYIASASQIQVAVSRSASGTVLSWPSTGQPFYTVFRSTSPALFGQAEILTTITTTTFTDVGAATDGVDYFYRVE